MTVSYNQRDFVEQALESALSQDYPNLQVVISDDASTDGTDAVIARVAERHPGRLVPILNKENVGVTHNCNIALERCTGDYVAFLAGDDIFLPGKISAQVAWLEERRERVLCGHQAEVFYDDASSPPHPFQRRLRRGKGASTVIRKGAFAACSVMVRADALPSHGFEESLPIVSDYMLWVEMLANGGEFGYVPGIYSRYRRHQGNVSNDVWSNVKEAMRSLQLIEQRYPQYKQQCRHARGRFVHYPIGMYHLVRGERKEARQAFLRAIRLEPTFPRPWIGYMQASIRS